MLADGDDPPYPSNGAAHVIRLLSKAAEKLSNSGHLELTVLVDSKGKAQSVEIIASPSKALAMVAAKTVIDEKFKPAVCGGQPCAMVFLLSITIEEAGVHR
jgi:outer membrane biosynthesis protein TonB